MIKKPFKGFILTTCIILSLLGILSTGIFVLFETQKGQEFLLRHSISYLEKQGIYLKMEGFEGDFPKNFSLQKITFYEPQNIPLLTIEHLKINFKWQDIFKGKLTFKTITAEKVILEASEPHTPSSPPGEEVLSFLKMKEIPSLPFSLSLNNLDIQDLTLPRKTELGEEGLHLHLRGFLNLPDLEGVAQDTALIKLDGINIPAHALLRIDFDPFSKKLNGTIEIEDSPHGLLNIGEPLSFSAHFEKDLNSSELKGILTFFTSSISNLESDFTLTLSNTPALAFKGSIEIPTLLKEFPAAFSPIFNFDGTVFFKTEEIFTDFILIHPDFKLSGQGTYSLNQENMLLDGTAEILNLEWVKSFEPPSFLDPLYDGLPLLLSFNIRGDSRETLSISLSSHEEDSRFSFNAQSSVDTKTGTTQGTTEIKIPFEKGTLNGFTHFTWENHIFSLIDLSLTGPDIDIQGKLHWRGTAIPYGEISFEANHLNNLNINFPSGHLKGILTAAENSGLHAEVVGEFLRWQDFDVEHIHLTANSQNYTGKGLLFSLVITNLGSPSMPPITLKGEAKGDLDLKNPLNGILRFTTLKDPSFLLNILFDAAYKDQTFYLTIQPLKTTIHKESLALKEPLKVIISGDSFICPEAIFQMGQSTLNISFEKKDTHLKGLASLDNFSFELLQFVHPSFAIPVIMSGKATLTGTIFDPSFVFKASLSPEKQKTFFEEPVSSLQGNVEGNWNGRILEIGFNLKNKAENLNLKAHLPLVLEDGKHLTFLESAPLKVTATGSGDLETLAPFLISEGDLLKGEISLSLLLEGSLKEKHLSGYIKINKGSYQSFKLGTVLRNITFHAQGMENRFQILKASAQDSSEGDLQITGFFSQTITEQGPRSYNLHMHLNNFRSVSLDLITVTATGDLDFLKDPKSHEPTLAGELTLTPVSVHIPKKFPSNIPVLPVVRVGSLDAIKAEILKEQSLFLHTLQEESRQKLSVIELIPPPVDETVGASSLVPSIPLQIRMNIPSKFSVDGWGLTSLWQGNIDISGNLDVPILNGNLSLVSGSYTMFGKTFSLLKGSLSFTGSSEIDPLVNVVAQITTPDIVAQILIDGRLTSPEFTLQSQPILPPGEIVSRILFGKGIGSLTPFQSLQIASSLSDLTGAPGPLSFVDEIRNSLGLGALSFTSGTSSSGPGLNLGRFLSNDVSLNVTPDLTTNSAQASVEIKVFPHVTIQSDLDTQSAAGAGINWQWDYD